MHALAAMTHAQAAYDVVVPAVPVTDTIQFLETERFGRSVWDDFGLSHNDNGDFLKTPEEIATLKMWSPLQNIALLRDPVKPTLLLTADTDERVEPAQTVRMAKALQEQFGLDAPVYLWVEPSAGHAASTGVDELTFIAKQLDIAALKPLVPRSGP